MLNPIVLSGLFLMVIGVCGILFVWANWNVNDINSRINYHLREQSDMIQRVQSIEDTARDHVTQLYEANRYANELHERTLKIVELEDSRKALWDALIELEKKRDRLETVLAQTQQSMIEANSTALSINDLLNTRILALERKAEDSGRIQAGGGVNRMRALISEQGGVKDGMMQQGFVR